MEQLKDKKPQTEHLAEHNAKTSGAPLEINGIQDFLKWVFIESTAKWLFIILLFEYIVAVNLSPTILTDYPLFNWIVEKMAFIPAVHNFDDIAVHPEAVRFYIALAFLLLIPKSISIYYFLVKNPITGMSTYVITPYTTTKPASTRRMIWDSWQKEKDVVAGEQKPRSMFSRVFWSLLTLLFTIGFVAGFANIGYGLDYDSQALLIQKSDVNIANGGVSIWFDLSIFKLTLSGLFIAVSAFIIKDYIRCFIALFRRVFNKVA